jgi:hypothetical protein
MRPRDAGGETRSAAKYLSTDVPINKVPQSHSLRSMNRSRASICSQLSPGHDSRGTGIDVWERRAD